MQVDMHAGQQEDYMTTPPLNTTLETRESPGQAGGQASTMVTFRATPDVLRLIDEMMRVMCITRTQAIGLCITAACAHWQTAPPDDFDGGVDE